MSGTASRGAVAGVDSTASAVSDSDWDTSKRKEAGLTSGPGWSASEGRRAVSGSGWANEAGLRPKRIGEGELRPGTEKERAALVGLAELAPAARGAGGSGPR